MVKTLVTGGRGFIGKNLKADYKINSQHGDLRDPDVADIAIWQFRPEAIIHAAGLHGNYANMADRPVEYYTNNTTMDANVLAVAQKHGIQKLIALSSVTAFSPAVEVVEENLHEGQPHSSCYGYAFAKRNTEILCRAYRDQYDVDYTCLFLSNMYGPHNDFSLERGTVVSVLIHKIYMAYLNNRDVHLVGDGSPVRDFMFVKDLNKVIRRVMDTRLNDCKLIVASGTTTTIKELAETIAGIIGFNNKIIWDNRDVYAQQDKIPNANKLHQLFPDLEFTPLKRGLEETINWFRENDHAQIAWAPREK